MGSRAAARIHADRGFVMASSPFPFLASGDLQKQQKRNKPVDFSFFFFVFRSASLYRSVFFFPSLFQVAGCMTKKLSVTMLLSCLVGGDEGERSVV